MKRSFVLRFIPFLPVLFFLGLLIYKLNNISDLYLTASYVLEETAELSPAADSLPVRELTFDSAMEEVSQWFHSGWDSFQNQLLSADPNGILTAWRAGETDAPLQ